MRHKRISSRFSRTSSHRKALFMNLANSIIEHELIKTTLPKAKTLRRYIEPLITIAGEDSVAKRRQVFAVLRNKATVAKLFTDIGPKNKNRPGGYVRVLKCGFRKGDCAPMAIVQLVESSQ